MDVFEKRQLIIRCSIDSQQKIATTAKTEMEAAQQQANEYGQPKDRYDSFRNKILHSRDMYAKQYAIALDNIRYLEALTRMSVSDTIDYGSIVVTSTQKLLIAIGIGKFPVEKDMYFGISTQVPIFSVLKGKKAGETVTFNGIKHSIIEVF